MSKYRDRLPQLNGRLCVTDSGLETQLIFHDGLELPYFAAFELLKNDEGTDRLRRYYARYADIARAHGLGLVLEAPTWRANPDWAEKLGYEAPALAEINRKAIDLMLEIRRRYETANSPMVISGNLGPRGDGYAPDNRMSVEQACDYHAPQIETFAQTEADMVAAFTINYVEEGVGIVRAAKVHGMPMTLSFTLETDGRLPSGDTLARAIERTEAETGAYAAYYMINCAHPSHFEHVLRDAEAWRERIRGLRANASKRSHAELDESTDLDDGDPAQLGREYRGLQVWLPNLTVVGGCCGTDHRHVEAMCEAMTAGN
ncbi:MAG: homocysteine S-methyltransferase family protein [Gammaproteobacteria bacterium]|nr:homocysteine S-methyltransferase family protein [Gammaproteobacteria bacterium]